MAVPDTGQRKRISNGMWMVGPVTIDGEGIQRMREGLGQPRGGSTPSGRRLKRRKT